MVLVLMIIGALAVATTVGWTLATLVKVDFSPGRSENIKCFPSLFCLKTHVWTLFSCCILNLYSISVLIFSFLSSMIRVQRYN